MIVVCSVSDPVEKNTSGAVPTSSPVLMMTMTPPMIGHSGGFAINIGGPVGVVSTGLIEMEVVWSTGARVETVIAVTETRAKALSVASSVAKSASRARFASTRASS